MIIVIGILAAVTIIGYGAWRQNVAEAQVKSDLTNVGTAMEEARNTGNAYPTSLPAGFSASDTVTLTYVSGDERNYCINGRTSVEASIKFYISSDTDGKVQAGSCAAPPGMEWTEYTASLTGNVEDVAYGAGKFVTVQSGGGSQRAYYSADGQSWTAATSAYGGSATWKAVAYGGGRFVALSSYDYAMASTDGVTWTGSTQPYQCQADDIAYGAGVFVGLLNHCEESVTGFYSAVITSADGQNWTAHALPTGIWYSLVYGNSTFVISGEDGIDSGISATLSSTDGVSWTKRGAPVTTSTMIAEAGQFILMDAYQGSVTSSNLTSWASHSMPVSSRLDIAYGSGAFVTVGSGGIMTSSDNGVTWTVTQTEPTVDAVAFGNGKFIVIGGDSSTRKFFVSP